MGGDYEIDLGDDDDEEGSGDASGNLDNIHMNFSNSSPNQFDSNNADVRYSSP